jgi:hypothetical protein
VERMKFVKNTGKTAIGMISFLLKPGETIELPDQAAGLLVRGCGECKIVSKKETPDKVVVKEVKKNDA